MSLKDELAEQQRLAEVMWLQDEWQYRYRERLAILTEGDSSAETEELRQFARKEATDAVQKLRLGL